MTRHLTAWVLAFAAGPALLVARQEPSFRAATHTVSIYATVVDSTGRLVPDLAQSDFQILDNGTAQPITVFANDIQPITIVIMLDRSASMIGNFRLVRDAAEHFVSELLPADKARLGSFSSRVQIDPVTFTSDKAELVKILHEDLQDAGPTPLWNATSAAIGALGHETGRKVVLIFTDGKDSPGHPFGNTSLPEVLARSQREEVMLYGIGLADVCESASVAPSHGDGKLASFRSFGRDGLFQRGPYGPRMPRGPISIPRNPLPPGGGGVWPPPGAPGGGDRPGTHGPDRPGASSYAANNPCRGDAPDPGLKELAEDGGGGYFELHRTDDLTSTFSRVADELHHQYLIAFTPAVLDGQKHDLTLKVGKPGMNVRARKSYVAASGS
jgi:VWFA-related protein